MMPFSRFSSYFIAVARQGSLRKAAEFLHVSASAIDRQILGAEAQLQVKLFERAAKGLRLTAAGEQLLNDLRRWQKEYGRTLERFDEIKGLKRGRVSIAVVEALAEGFFIDSLAQTMRDLPHLTFDLRVETNAEVSRLVVAADVDFGLLLDPHDIAGLQVRDSVQIPIGLAVAPGHALAERRRLVLSDALEYRQVMPAAPLLVHERARALYARHQVDQDHAVVCNDIRMMRALIRSGAGVGVLSRLDVANEVQEGRLAFVAFAPKYVKPLSLGLCVAPRRQLSRAAQAVMQSMLSALKEID